MKCEHGYLLALTVATVLFLVAGPSSSADDTDSGSPVIDAAPQQRPVRRPFRPLSGGRWIGNAVAYGPFRDGQYPGGPAPTTAQLRQDVQIMLRHWNLLRMYDSVGAAENVLEIIRHDGLDMKVMLGAWIAPEKRRDENGALHERLPEAQAANGHQVDTAIRLANEYPDVVIAVSVGNETQVYWSSHKSSPEVLIEYVRRVRTRTHVPVTVADDYNFWNKPESRLVAGELDFIVMHAHPLWNGVQLDQALAWTKAVVAEVQSTHPGHTIVLGETGWATKRHNEGEQATLIRGATGEREQRVYYNAVTAWAIAERVPVFFFEAFDENWKGGDHPDEVEKHWGLYRADRTPKMAVAPE